MDAAELRWQQDTQGRTHLCVSGHWTLATRKPDLQAVFEAFAGHSAELPVRVTVAAWDSSLLALLRRLQRLATERAAAAALAGTAGRRRAPAADGQRPSDPARQQRPGAPAGR